MDVSIIIPVFNRPALVPRAIESALADRKPGWEIIVVDDGSTDETPSVIGRYGADLTIIRQDNRGVSSARNRGLSASSGRYVKFLDSDDQLVAGGIGHLLAAAEGARSTTTIFFGDAISTSQPRAASPRYDYGFRDAGTLPRARLLSGTMSSYLPLFPREQLVAIGGFDEHIALGEDQHLAVRLAYEAGVTFQRVACDVISVGHHDGVRLSRIAQCEPFVALANRLASMARPGCTEDEAVALGQRIWGMGREAVRRGDDRSAHALFVLAKQVAGQRSWNASGLTRLLYKWLDPVRTEKAVTQLKKYGTRPETVQPV